MNGQLREHPLGELIAEIGVKGFSGALRVARERARAVLYFEAGGLVYASTNMKAYRLSEYVRKHGHQLGSGDQAKSDFDVADLLLARRIVSQSTLDAIRAEQVGDVVRMVLLWLDGEWSFDERARLSNPTRVSVPLRQLLIEAARHLEIDFACSRLSNPRELISLNAGAIDGVALRPLEGFMLSRLEGPTALSDLQIISGQPDAPRTIYGLLLGGLLDRELWPHAFKRIVPKAEKPEQEPKKSRPAVLKEEPVLELVRNAEDELIEFLEQQDRAQNYYEMLRIQPSVNPTQIKNAYHALARRYHPDRFHELSRTPLHARLESAFARITSAQETLLDQQQRASYDAKIAAFNRAGTSIAAESAKRTAANSDDRPAEIPAGDDRQSPEKYFQEGVAALQLGQINAAISALSAAARQRPDRADYRAYLGRALSRNDKTQRLAEGELQMAIKLEPANPSYHVMLASLYTEIGFPRRALSQLERALSLDSQNAEAREMMRLLKAKK